jgi:hypothetical protein
MNLAGILINQNGERSPKTLRNEVGGSSFAAAIADRFSPCSHGMGKVHFNDSSIHGLLIYHDFDQESLSPRKFNGPISQTNPERVMFHLFRTLHFPSPSSDRFA